MKRKTNRRFLILLLNTIFCLAVFSLNRGDVQGEETNREALTIDSLDIYQTIIERVAASHKKENVSAIEETAAHYLSILQSDGSFADIDYTEKSQTNWKPVVHLDRLKAIVLAYTMTGNKYSGNHEVYSTIVRMLEFWYTAHPTSTNWYMQQIACPQRTGVLLILMRSGAMPLPVDIEDKLIDRIKAEGGRPDQKGSLGTAANKLDIATHWIYRGCLTADVAVLSFGMEQAYQPLILTTGEGLQHDFSYQQHGNQLYIGGYGFVIIDGISKIATYTIGTPYELSGEKLQLLSLFIRKAYLPTIRGRHFLYNVLGRGLSREGALSQSGVSTIIERMVSLDPSYADVYKDAICRLNDTRQADYGLASSHTHFWRSDYTLHQRPDYTADVRMASKYTGRNENGNGENLKGYFLTDGAMDIAMSGDEYLNIFPVWDWNRIPGVTAPVIANIPQPTQWFTAGESTFAGGVSDGKYGVSAYLLNDYKYGINTTARKSWFFFDDEVVCLGSGIKSSSTAEINTTVNQSLLKTDVTVCLDKKLTTLAGNSSETSKDIKWVHHDKVAYYFPQGGNVTVGNLTQKGSWQSINSSRSDEPVSNRVFKMWLNHGISPDNERYSYIIAPNKKTIEEVENYSVNNITIVANSDSVQGVRHNDLNILGLVFYKAASFKYGDISIRADNGCLLLIKDIDSSCVKISISDPTRVRSIIKLAINIPSVKGERYLDCEFPVYPDPYAGSSFEYTIKPI